MFSRKKHERCKSCSKFLTDELRAMNNTLYVNCAKKIVSSILKSYRVRVILGFILVVAVFLFIDYMRNFAFEHGEGVLRVIRVPVVFDWHLTFRPVTFDSIMNLTLVQQLILAVVAFMIPFAKRVHFGMDKYHNFSSAPEKGPHPSAHRYLLAGWMRGSGDRVGIMLSEFALTVISGPYFFLHGLVNMVRFLRYVRRIII